MTEAYETVIVGGGQAALALSYFLSQLGREHVILEGGRVAERWRSERWDSLAFQFPNWSIRLPGYEYRGGDPDGFAPRDEVVRFIEQYRDVIKAPVRTGVHVRSVTQKPGSTRFLLQTDDASLQAGSVVIATGPYQAPALPPAAVAVDLFQVHSSRYRNPAALPPGATLVVGSGASGCQIVEDLLEAGRTVYLSVGRHRRVPRRYRGRDVFWWLTEMGALDQTVDQRPEERRTANPLVTGVHGGHDIDLRDYAARGVTLLGHVRGVQGGKLFLAADLDHHVTQGDQGFTAFTRSVDDFVLQTGMDAPKDVQVSPSHPGLPEPPGELDLHAAGITSMVWATGFRYDLGWIRLPVLDEAGEPVHRRGVTRCPGLYFLGLAWLHKLKSSVLCGVGEDAAYLVERIAERT